MNRIQLAASGLVRFDPSRPGDPRRGIDMDPRYAMWNTHKQLVSAKALYWQRDVCIVGMTPNEIRRELGKQITRMRSHDSLGAQFTFCLVETI